MCVWHHDYEIYLDDRNYYTGGSSFPTAMDLGLYRSDSGDFNLTTVASRVGSAGRDNISLQQKCHVVIEKYLSLNFENHHYKQGRSIHIIF